MENIDDLKPYLNLREGEEILFINRWNEDLFLPINELYKYHEPENFPEDLITKKKKDYVYRPIDIITNFRVILFGLNLHLVKNDQVTPISDLFHFENFIVWINNENIIDFEIRFGEFLDREIQFIFYHEDGIRRAKTSPIYIHCFKYKNYIRAKEVAANLFKFKKEEIDQVEQREIGSIIAFNKFLFYLGLIGLVLIGILLFTFAIFDSSSDLLTKLLKYSSVIVYSLYLVFYLIFNIINWKKLQKTRNSEDFLKLMEKDFTWYKGPSISFVFFMVGIVIIMFEWTFSFLTDNIFLIQMVIVGVFLSIILLTYLIEAIIEKKREKNHFKAIPENSEIMEKK